MPNSNIDQNPLIKVLHNCKRAIAFNFLFSFFISFFTLATSIYSLQILDRVLSSSSVETLMMLSLIMLIIYIILGFLQAIRSLILMKIANWLDQKLSPILLNMAICGDNKNAGSQDLRDLNNIKSFITSNAASNLFDAPFVIIYFIVIFIIHYINGFIALTGAIILFFLAFLNDKLTRKKLTKAQSVNIIAMQKIDALSQNFQSIKSMAMSDNLLNSWQKINNQVTRNDNQAFHTSTIINSITKSIRLLIQMITMAVAALLVISNQMSAGGIIAISILTSKALAPFDALISIYRSLVNCQKSLGRINQKLQNNYRQDKKIKFGQIQADLGIEKLSYKHPQAEKLIIKNINIKIRQGQIIAVIGKSGSGKTTLIQLIAGIIKPSKGLIRIGGWNINDLELKQLGKYIGFLPQNIQLFDDSVKNNIARMDQKASDQQVIKAAKLANVHDIILKFDQGYQTNCHKLSFGQKQRVALARAFYGDVKLVILDEPNSNLDVNGNNALINCLITAKKQNITVIIVSHRPEILSTTDKTLVIHQGEAKLFDDTQIVLKKLQQ